MNVERIEELLRALGSKKITFADRSQGRLVRAECPLAPWDHAKGTDRHPSFAITVQDDDRSFFSCFTCGKKGNLSELVRMIEFRSGEKLKDLIQFVQAYDLVDLNKKIERLKLSNHGFYARRPGEEWDGGKVDPVKMAEAFTPLPADASDKMRWMMEQVNEAEAMEYLLENRKLSPETIIKWKLGWHPGARRIAVPQWDTQGRLVNISGRYIPSILDTWEPQKWLHAKGFKREAFLFGEDRLILPGGQGVVFLVEGMFDAIYLDGKGLPNVLAILGSDLAYIQKEKLVAWCSHLVVIADGDKAGRDCSQKVMLTLGKRMNVSVFNTPDGKDPDQLDDTMIEDIKSRFLS